MWEKRKLGDVVNLKNGYAFKSTEYSDEGVPVIRISDINDNLVTTKNAKNVPMKDEFKSFQIEKDSILIAMSGATTGKFGIFRSNEKALQNQRVGKFEYDDRKISNQFLYYLLYNLKRQILNEAYGGAQPNISSRKIEAMEVEIPSLPTQNRIVEKIEELFSELDNGTKNLKKAQKQLKTYRQAVLKDAFEGKLTYEWREKQDHLSTPEELLQQINAERKAHHYRELAKWEKVVEQWEKNGEPGRKPRKPRKVNEVETITEKNLNKLADLPNNWLWVKLGRVIDQPKYGTSEKCDYDFDGYGVLRIPNIGKGIIVSEDIKYAPLEEDEASKYALDEGDILTIRSNGSIDLVGKCALIREPDTKFLYAGYLIRLRPYNGVADSRYLLNILSSVSLRSQIESKAKSTSGVNNINSGELQDLIIPICGVKEQVQIVNEIESRLSVVDQLELTINENLLKAEALRQSILKKAFQGELVEE